MQMHEDQVDASEQVARRLIDAQYPQWSHLRLQVVDEFGTDHRLYRLGDDLLVRLPVYPGSAGQAATDARWLPLLQEQVSVRLPAPVASGRPDDDYPFAWSVVPWMPGRPPVIGTVDSIQLAADLAAFVSELHSVDPEGGPVKEGTSRGTPVRRLDGAVRAAIVAACDRIDGDAALSVWEDCTAAPDHAGPSVWIHGDLNRGNLLVDDEGRLSSVIDFGAIGVGDPAVDLTPAWSVVAGARNEFLAATGYDEHTIRRARGWALAPALTGIPYYWDTVREFAEIGQHTVAEVIRDYRA